MMKPKLPGFRNAQEEAKFWDVHDSTDYLGDLQKDTETIFVRPEVGVIELGSAMWKRLQAEARRRRTTPQRLVQRWVKERLTGAD